MKETCRYCGQPLPGQYFGGIYLPPMKARIFRLIKQKPGISTDEINVVIFHGRASKGRIRQHVYQINVLLAATDYVISGNLVGLRGCYRLVTLKQLAKWSNYERHMGWKPRSGRPRRLATA